MAFGNVCFSFMVEVTMTSPPNSYARMIYDAAVTFNQTAIIDREMTQEEIDRAGNGMADIIEFISRRTGVKVMTIYKDIMSEVERQNNAN